MNLHTPLSTKLGAAAFALATLLVGLVLLARFGGPSLRPQPTLKVTTLVSDAGGLQKGADVLVHGVRVGTVRRFDVAGGRSRLQLALLKDKVGHDLVHADATVQISAKTPLGESFVDLQPGTRGTLRDGARLRSRPAVEIDEALRALDPAARRQLTGLLGDTGRALRSPASGARVRATVEGLDQTVSRLGDLGDALRGQDGEIAQTVGDARTVLQALAARQQDVAGTVRAARTTLAATADQRAALRATLAQLPLLAQTATRTLSDAHPLAREATPVVTRLGDAAPDLTTALRALPPALRDADALVRRAPALDRAATPALAALRRLTPELEPALRKAGPALADLVPMVDYLAPRTKTITAWFSNTADLGSNGDAKGRWARFFVLADPSSAFGAPTKLERNAYTQPGDAAANRPFQSGDFPRLRPFRRALPGTG